MEDRSHFLGGAVGEPVRYERRLMADDESSKGFDGRSDRSDP